MEGGAAEGARAAKEILEQLRGKKTSGAPWTGQSVLVFLGGGRLSAKAPVFEGWKSLDFLGFCGIETNQLVTLDFR